MVTKHLKFVNFLMLFVFVISISSSEIVFAQKKNKKNTAKKEEQKDEFSSSSLGGLKFRSIGPAYASGRIADFAVNPNNHSEWYVGVASGNIWKTTNNGQTFKPVFENYGTYSIGALAMDPNNPNVVWAGTGENNHQRALAYGDGVYKTVDGGKSWKNMGLKDSRQIGKIVIDPRNSDIVFVAAEGSAWGPGGERGLYKTTDGGKNWKKVLNISENTGINNVVIDPSNPDIMYATSEQRRRHVYTKIGGGPESAVYKSTDGGETWRKLTSGLPSGDVGGMGIAVSPVDPNVVYLIVEDASKSGGGFYRSTDKGESWTKMSDHHSSGQYYNEIYCDPKNVDKVYSVETFSHVTTDGGKTWKQLGISDKHVDDHALWIDPDNTKHFIIGGDGGVYITYDGGNNYRHVSNLPITQYYRVYLDNDYPFYNVYGGTQDNNSMGGPSRNLSSDGVTSGEWVNTVGGDGFWGRVDPQDPNIVYSEWQYGNVIRFDKKSRERLNIKPQPGKGELSYKWNWNAPFIISRHNHKRLYIAANKVFRSDDRGQSWKVLSPDLTAQIDRNTWKVMGKYWSSDAVRKDVSTSLYGTIVSMEESPVKENLIYVGTDDGLIQVTEDAKNWRKSGTFPGVPANTYVSDVYPSRFDENVVFASFDNRKRDDFKPYLLKSTDKGKTWTSIAANLPKNGTVHTIEQDFKNPDLLFVGTEFGFFYSYNGGKNWIQLKSGLPTIAVRDIALQERENDIAIATFGRGFYILDDYSPLREANPALKNVPAKIFPVKDALAYMQTGKKYGQGATYFIAKNPPFGATFTYWLKEAPKSQKQIRKEKEKELFKEGKPIKQLSWEEQRNEKMLEPIYLLFTISDSEGNVVRKLTAKPSAGINRITWDLRYTSPMPVSVKDKFDPFKKAGSSLMILPGKYKVSMTLVNNGTYTELVSPQEFTVKALNNTTLPAADREALVAFQKKIAEKARLVRGAMSFANDLWKKTTVIKQTILSTSGADKNMMEEIRRIQKELDEVIFAFRGFTPKASYEEIPPHKPAINRRLNYLMYAHYSSTAEITQTEREQLAIIEEEMPELINKLKTIATKDIPAIEQKLEAIGAPWTPDRLPEWK